MKQNRKIKAPKNISGGRDGDTKTLSIFVLLGAGLINTCIWYSLTIIAHSFNNLVKKHFIRKEKKTIENKERTWYPTAIFDWYNSTQ